MKKMRAIENIRVEETLYKPGEEFEIAEEETNVGGLKEAKTSKKGTKNE